MSMKFDVQMFSLSADGKGTVHWEAPDGNTYTLNSEEAKEGEWKITNDEGGKPVMALLKQTGKDAELVVSLDGAAGIAATLLHEEDDQPRYYYFATDMGNNNKLGRPAFRLQSMSRNDCPVAKYARFRVLCFG